MSSSEDHTHCTVCFEKYNLNERTPRILPCFHTLCHTCIKSLLKKRRNHLLCPVCRKNHKVEEKGAQTFQENAYIVSFIQNAKQSIATTSDFPQCKLHNRELVFYCRNDSCKKTICAKGLREEHNEHDVVDVEDEHKERSKIIEEVINKADESRSGLFKLNKEAKERHGMILLEIEKLRKKSKEEIDRALDYFMKKCIQLDIKYKEDVMAGLNHNDQLQSSLAEIWNNNGKPGFLPDMKLVEKIRGDLDGLRTYTEGQSEYIHAARDNVNIKLDIVATLGSETDHVERSLYLKNW